MRAVLYAAKSTTDERGSIPGQLADCREAAEAEGQEVVAEHHDEAASAYKGNRGDGLTRAKEDAIAHGAELWVQHSDRLARGDGITADHLAEVWFALRRHGVRIRSVQDDHNLEDALRVVLIGERNYEDSDRKAKAVKAGLRRRAADRGKLVGGPRPYGYRWVSELVDGRKVSHLEVVPAEAEVVRRIFEDTVNGVSQRSLARRFNQEGIPTVNRAPWGQPTIGRILKNPLYKGRVRNAGEEFDGVHESIVTGELWDQAAAIRSSTARRKGGRWPKGSHLFTGGLLRCHCGSAMLPRTDPTRGAPRTRSTCVPAVVSMASSTATRRRSTAPWSTRRCSTSSGAPTLTWPRRAGASRGQARRRCDHR